MEEVNGTNVPLKASCPHCGSSDHHCCHGNWARGGKFFLVRWLLALLALCLIFAVGYKLGEFRSGFFYPFGGYMRMNRMPGCMYHSWDFGPGGRGMMYERQWQSGGQLPKGFIPSAPSGEVPQPIAPAQ
jgi:hypothetical protein